VRGIVDVLVWEHGVHVLGRPLVTLKNGLAMANTTLSHGADWRTLPQLNHYPFV
jgi:hypothetical protein